MPRRPRHTPAGTIFHVINRAVGRHTIFHKPEDYAAFERVLAEAHGRVPIRILAYTLMANHWHLVLWPRSDDELPEFVKWMTHAHTQRWHAHYHTSGTGHLYQGRYKSFPVQGNVYLLVVLRYVERNGLRANLVARAQDWSWSSLWRREHGQGLGILSDWPVPRPADWLNFVNEPQTQAELEALRRSVNRGCPFGDDEWQKQVVTDLGLEATLRPRGRPPKSDEQEPEEENDP
jgi:putative transposase